MKTTARFFLLSVFIALFLAVCARLLIETVPVAKIGVKQRLWGGTGVVQRDYETGFHLGITGIHKWYFLDARTHFLTFGAEGSKSSSGQFYPPLELRTEDNNIIQLDLTVTYRIIPGEAYKMVEEAQQEIYRDRLGPVVEKELRDHFAQLSSEEIIITDERLEVVNSTLPRLAEAMRAFHVEPERILIRAVSFQPIYEEKLQQKQLFEQKRLLATAQKLVEDQQAQTDGLATRITAAEKNLRGDWDKRLQEALSDNQVAIAGVLATAEVYAKETRAEADADFEVSIATGNLAVARSEALRNELRNRALDTVGGRIFLAKQAAQNLTFDHVTLNSNDPSVPSILDIGELSKMLIGEPGEAAEGP